MDLLVRAAFKVVPIELAMSGSFWFAFSGWSSFSVSRLVIFRWDRSPIARQNRYDTLL